MVQTQSLVKYHETTGKTLSGDQVMNKLNSLCILHDHEGK